MSWVDLKLNGQAVTQKQTTVKLGDKERFVKEQICVFKEPFSVTNLLHKDKEHLALKNKFRMTKMPYHQVRLYFSTSFGILMLHTHYILPQKQIEYYIYFYCACFSKLHNFQKLFKGGNYLQKYGIHGSWKLRSKTLIGWKKSSCEMDHRLIRWWIFGTGRKIWEGVYPDLE